MIQPSATVALTFAVYLMATLAIGAVAYRRTRDLADYILGGRRLGPWVSALSAGASDMSGWLLLGLPGYAYLAGLEATWIALGLLLGTYANWRLVAHRLRVYSELAGNSLTLPEFLERRFHDDSRLLRMVSAAVILVFFLIYTSAGLVAGGKLFTTVFGLPYAWALLAGTLAIIAYTLFGGFLAVSWTDLFQGLLMAAALVVTPLVALATLGGWNATLEAVARNGAPLLDPFTNADGQALGLLGILSLMAWGLGYFGQPHILARFKAIRDAEAVPAARRIATAWVAFSLAGALLVGLAGVGHVSPPLTGSDSEKVFMVLVGSLFHPLVAGILLAAILAAIMSTADSQLLVSASAFTEDFYKTLLRREPRAAEMLWVGRGAVLVIALLALALAWDPGSKVLELVAYAWAGFGAAFGPALLLSLYWRRMTRAGALAGILVGGITVVVWRPLSGGLFDLYEILPGFVFSMAAIVLVSLASPAPDTLVLREYDAATRR